MFNNNPILNFIFIFNKLSFFLARISVASIRIYKNDYYKY